MTKKYWIGVVSREHVKIGEVGGFCQLCHGKDAPVRRMSPGDWLIYYSPREKMRGGETVQAFTAIGRIKPREPYTHNVGNGFIPTRRDVDYYKAKEVSIRPMLDDLSFSANNISWGMILRRGVFEIPVDDFHIISAAMGVNA